MDLESGDTLYMMTTKQKLPETVFIDYEKMSPSPNLAKRLQHGIKWLETRLAGGYVSRCVWKTKDERDRPTGRGAIRRRSG